MKKTTLALGMHDKLFKRARTMYQIEHRICDLLMTKGFLRIETPTLEHFEVFCDVVDNGNYNFFDKNGDLVSLRPDITSQIGRVIASTQVHTPIKFSYSGKVFNYNEEMRGLSNEHTQAGIEIIGFPVHQAMEEAVISAKEALDAAGVKNYKFEFSHARLLQLIFEELDLPAVKEAELADYIRDKSITGLKEFTKENPSQYDKVLEQLPFLFGETKAVLTKARELTDSEAFLTALDSLEVLTNRLADSLPETTLDLAQLPAVPYYTGMMFKVFGDKVPDAFVSGGRYDKLFERFGATELTAVGWAIDVDSVYQAVHDDVEFGGDLDD